jgi:hypothetical protein
MKLISILFAATIVFGCVSNQEKYLDFEKEFGNQEQVFVINNYSDTVIIGALGTQVRIPKDIVTERILENDTFKVILREYYSLSDMILAGLSTTSDGRLLETKGMINLDFRINNSKISSLKNALQIRYKSKGNLSTYSIFHGDLSENGINWVLDTITKNYHIFLNIIMKGRNTGADMGLYTTRLDSIPWDKSYTAIDSIITFTESDDTLDIPEYASEETLLTNIRDLDYVYRSFKLDWINLDKYVDELELTSIKVVPSIKGKHIYFLVFNELNSIVQNSGNNEFLNVPIGQSVILIGLDKIGGKMFFGMSNSFKVSKSMTIKLELKETDAAKIKQKIRKINK